MKDLSQGIAEGPAGPWLIRMTDLIPGAEGLHKRVVEKILEAVGEAKGPMAARDLRQEGLGQLHRVLRASEVTFLRDRVIGDMRNDLLRFAVSVGRELLDLETEFYVDDYIILRVNLPFEIARREGPGDENPGIGRVSPDVRQAATERRVKDPVYNPREYHKGYPPAAWAHGPHLDSWGGHSRGGFNLWWAISDVPAEAGMVFYPDFDPGRARCDPRTLYLQSGQTLPPPTYVPLREGEMVVFDPERLHGTHLNVTDVTRVAISLRLNRRKPTFNPDSFFAREFWRRAQAIEAGDYGEVLHLKREENLGAPSPGLPDEPPRAVPPQVRSDGRSEWTAMAPSSQLTEGARLEVIWNDRKVLMFRIEGEIRAVDASCPHYGVDLSDGAARGGTIHCPACAVGFSLRTGACRAPSLRLRTFAARETEGTIYLTPDPGPGEG